MFSVGDTTIAIDPATEFEEGSCAELQPGVWVEAEGTLTSDGEVAASEIEVEVESGALPVRTRTRAARNRKSLPFWFLSGIGAALAGSMANKSNIVIDLRGWRTPSVSGEELQALGKSGPRYTAEITRGLPVPRG